MDRRVLACRQRPGQLCEGSLRSNGVARAGDKTPTSAVKVQLSADISGNGSSGCRIPTLARLSARCVAVVRLVGPTVAEIQPLRTVRHPGRSNATGAFSSMYIQYIRRPGISQVSFFQEWHVDDACRILSPGPFRHTFLHTICIYINMLRCVCGRVKDFHKISPHRAMKKTLEYRGRPTGHKKSRPHTRGRAGASRLTVVLDAFSRRIGGWSMANSIGVGCHEYGDLSAST